MVWCSVKRKHRDKFTLPLPKTLRTLISKKRFWKIYIGPLQIAVSLYVLILVYLGLKHSNMNYNKHIDTSTCVMYLPNDLDSCKKVKTQSMRYIPILHVNLAIVGW